MHKRLIAVLFTLGCVFQLQAQGTAFTYQGRLNGVSGPATGNYDFAFTVYDAVVVGNAVAGPVTNSAVSVSNGLFTTTIDFGNAAFNGNSRWLDIAVRTNGSSTFFTLSPRQAFTPTPYSITAATITGPLQASQITGTIQSSAIAGTYGNQLTLNNANNQFTGTYSGNGAGVTNVNAATLNGLDSSAFWKTNGNNLSPGQFIGSINNQAVEIRANNKTAVIVSAGANDAPNIKGGAPINAIDAGVQGSVIAGGGTTNFLGFMSSNRISADFSSVSGGSGNWIQSGADHSIIGAGVFNAIGSNSYQSVIAGGQQSTISNSTYATIGGGGGHKISGGYGTVGGGWQNNVTNLYGTVAGGINNTAANRATVGGGNQNNASGVGSVVAGGGFDTSAGGNTASGNGSAIGGGTANVASGQDSTVPGGQYNTASGTHSFAAGRKAVAAHNGSFVWADETDAQFQTSNTNQFLVRASGGVGINTSNPNGDSLAVSGNRTGGWPSPVGYFENLSTDTNASPALRVVAAGTTTDGALSVSSQGTGLIARFGNGVAFVADVTTDGTVDAANFSGGGSGLTGLNASQLTSGTVPNSAFSGTYSDAVNLNNPANSFSGNGGALTNVNAATINGLASSNFWQTGGNNVSAGQFIGSSNNQAVEIRANNKTALLVSPGLNDSPNIKGGAAINTIDTNVQGSVIVGGGSTNHWGLMSSNHISADFSFIGGGDGNWIQANGDHSFIGSGYSNIISRSTSVIAGGQQNAVGGSYVTIGGGLQNTASYDYSTIGGGIGNTALEDYATIAGGNMNTAGSAYGWADTVGGGRGNNSTGSYSTIPGGLNNTAQAYTSFAAGNNANAAHPGAFVWADSTGNGMTSTGNDQFLVKAAGGVGINTNNPSGNALNVAGNVNATSFSGNGANITNLNAAQLTGILASAQFAGTYNSALSLNNSANSFTGNTLSINGNKTNGWPNPVVYFNNSSTATNASPALRVTAGGTTTDGALNVSATGNGLIARFGNAVTFVADITTNGTIDANAFSGNGSALTALNASQVTSGTLPSAQLSGTYSSPLTFNNQSDNFIGNYNVSTSGNLRLNDRALYLRGGGDVNHGLAYNGSGITNFGTGNVQVDGPVLWGFSGGALGVGNGVPHAALTWNSNGVTINGTLDATNTPGLNYSQSNSEGFTITNGTSTTIATVTAAKPATGYFLITAYVNAILNNNELFLDLYDTTSGTVFLTEADVTGTGAQTGSLTWVVPITSPGGSSTFALKVQTYTGTATAARHNLTVAYFPRLN